MRGSRFIAAVAAAAFCALAVGAPSVAQAPQNAQGVTDTTITIGTTLPLTGGAAVAGAGFQSGLQKAVDEINAKGGINGRKIQLTVLDDGFTAARAVANVLRLGDQSNVFAILGPAGTSNLPGSFPYVKRKGIPMFGPVNPADPNLDSVFFLATGLKDQHRVLVDYAKSKGIKTIGFIGADDAEGAIRKAGIDQQAKLDSLRIVASETVEAHSTDISSAVLAIRQKNPDAVFLGGDNTVSTLVLQQLQSLGWHPMVLGDSRNVAAGGAMVTKPAGNAANGLVGTGILALPDANTPAVSHWRSLGTPATAANFDLQDYATAQVFFEIVRRMGKNLTWPDFVRTAESLKGYKTGIIPPVTFGKYNENQPGSRIGTSGAAIAVYDNGNWKQVTDFLNPR